MFTDRFLKLPISIVSAEQIEKAENIGIEVDENEKVSSYVKILPMQIESYRPTSKKKEGLTSEDLIYVFIQTKSNDSYFVYLTIDEFEKLLNDFDK